MCAALIPDEDALKFRDKPVSASREEVHSPALAQGGGSATSTPRTGK
jgi:hypothetical protein